MADAPSTTLKAVLDDAVLAEGFAQFCAVQHAKENLDFYADVERFRLDAEAAAGGVVSPPAQKRAGMLSRLLGVGGAGKSPATADKTLSPRAGDRKTLTGGDAAAAAALAAMPLPERARRIFDEYLKPDSPKWVCIDLALSKSLEEQLKTADASVVTSSFFTVAQKQVFDNMEKDLLPRFLRSFEDSRRDTQEALFATSPRGSTRFFPNAEQREAMQKAAN